MLKSEEIRQKYPFFRKSLMILKRSGLRVVAFAVAQFAKKSEKTCDFVDIEYQKRISHSVTGWLSLYPILPRMLQMHPASHSYFMSIDKPTVVLEILGVNSV